MGPTGQRVGEDLLGPLTARSRCITRGRCITRYGCTMRCDSVGRHFAILCKARAFAHGPHGRFSYDSK